MEAFYQTLSKGYLFPRWASELNNGYGSSILILLPPLRNYLGASIHWLCQISFQTITKILFFNLNLIIFPLCLWLFYKLKHKAKYWFFLLAVFFFTALILNNYPADYFYFVFSFFSFFLWLTQQVKRKLKLALTYLALFISAFSLTAFYWLPATLEAKEIKSFLNNIKQSPITKPSPKVLTALTNTEKVEFIYQHRPPFLWYGYELNLPANTRLQFHVFNYSGWQVFFDSQPVVLEKPDQENKNLITFTSPPTAGYHFLEIVFEKTKVQALADTITFITLGLLISYAGYVYFQKRV